MTRKKLLLGNWKMNHTIAEANAFCQAVKDQSLVKLAKKKKIQIGVAPTFLSLQAVARHAHGMIVASQDCHYAPSGAFTSNVSIPMLEEIGVHWSIIGHSEKRTYENETSFTCNRKIKALLANDFHVCYCVGETEKEYDQGITKDVIKEQIQIGLMNVTKEQIGQVVIAYEPVWSIGTGKNASSEIAEDICSYIRGLINDMFGKVPAQKMQILYGGSVKPDNIHNYLTQADVDGALVGGASLKVDSFKALIENM